MWSWHRWCYGLTWFLSGAQPHQSEKDMCSFLFLPGASSTSEFIIDPLIFNMKLCDISSSQACNRSISSIFFKYWSQNRWLRSQELEAVTLGWISEGIAVLQVCSPTYWLCTIAASTFIGLLSPVCDCTATIGPSYSDFWCKETWCFTPIQSQFHKIHA